MKGWKKSWRWLLLAFLLAGAAIASVHYWLVWRERPYRELREALGTLQMHMERYAVDNEGSYPADLQAFVEEKKIDLPDNPFGKGKLRILKPGDPWVPGGVVYVGWGPIVMSEIQPDGTRRIYGGPGQTPYEISPGVFLPLDVDQYLLVAYSPKLRPRRKAAMEEAKHELELAMKKMAAGETEVSYPLYADGISWEHTEIMLTAGEDYLGLKPSPAYD